MHAPAQVLILDNAQIYTGDGRHPWARSLAVVDGKVAGRDAAAQAWRAAPGARVEDLGGATVIPGLIDAHIHLMWYALSLQELNLRDLSFDALLAAVAARASEVPPDTWITGRGWDQNLWEDRSYPTAAELDRAAPRHPVALIAKNAHALVANTAALRAAGVTAAPPDPARGRVGREADGTPNGMFFEHAMDLIAGAQPEPTVAQVRDALAVAQDHLLATGITGVHDVDGAPAFAAFQALRAQGALRVRVVKYVRLPALDGVLAAGLRSGFGDDVVRFGGLKLFADGALGARTGAMFAPYEGEPENRGMLTLAPETLQEIVTRAARGGVAVATHAIGDRANHVVLDALEAAGEIAPHLRHRVEHVQSITAADRQRLAQAGCVASMQPIHAIHDMAMADRYLGPRAGDAYAWRAVQEAGAVLAFGSDAPIEVFDPFLGLYAAVTRRREDGTPAEGWYPEQRLTLAEALRAYTEGAAYAAGQEARLGTLAPGYHADLAVLDRDIFALPPTALLKAQVQRTMVGGVWRFRREAA